MPLRIPVAIFVDRFLPGGTQRQMIELLKRLDRSRFRVHPVCFHTDGAWFGRVAELGDPVAVFPIHGFRRPGTARQLIAFASWCRAHHIAVLHTCELYSNIFGLPGGALASVPVRIGSRRGFVEPPGLQRLQRASYAWANRVVANSQAAAARLCREQVPEDRIVVIENGIDTSLFPLREYSPRPRRIAMVACLREEKGIDVLLSATPKVLSQCPDAEFLIVGDGSCREPLIALADRLRILDRVRFLGHRDDVPAVLARADVFVLPSLSEALPNSIMEAMAAGLPVVASGVGGIPELVEDERTGRLVPPGDPGALADALLGVLEQPGRAEEFGRAGRRKIEENFSFDRMVERFETLYETELATRRVALQRKGSRMKRLFKNTLMNAYLASGFPPARNHLYARFGRSRLTVLAYHQVKEDADDCSSVSPAEFRTQMQFIKRHYRVLPLSEAVKVASQAGVGERLVAITFDDGYRDNATVAAPILRSLNLPACFFVSTGMIGSDRPFPHDVVQRRFGEPHMTWDDVRGLVAAGFEVGSHTCSHADLGEVSLPDARRELRESRERLEHELGMEIRLFAFPYGHKVNMRPDTMAVAQQEYAVCCSAHGGHNTAPVDPGNVLRIVISPGVTFLAFRAILEGWPIIRTTNPYRAPEAAAPEATRP